ncbi:MAG: plasmid stability protein [Cyanobacteria bacterium J06621_3]
MTTITLTSVEPKLVQQLQQRAEENGRTIEAEIADILSDVLASDQIENDTLGLGTAIKQRFAPLGDFEIPEIPREPIRTPPTF